MQIPCFTGGKQMQFGLERICDQQTFVVQHLCNASGHRLAVVDQPDVGPDDALNHGFGKRVMGATQNQRVDLT